MIATVAHDRSPRKTSFPTAALFIDWENLVRCGIGVVGDSIRSVQSERFVSTARAYADWTNESEAASALTSLGIELTQLSRNFSGKNSADMQLAVEATELLVTQENLETLVLMSGDRDFLPLVQLARRHGCRVWGIGPPDASSQILQTICDRFDFLPARQRPDRQATAVPARPTQHLPAIDEALRRRVAEVFRIETRDEQQGIGLARFITRLREVAPDFDAAAFCGGSKRTHIRSARRMEQAGLLCILTDHPNHPHVRPSLETWQLRLSLAAGRMRDESNPADCESDVTVWSDFSDHHDISQYRQLAAGEWFDDSAPMVYPNSPQLQLRKQAPSCSGN